jgi:hypothetical protein
MQFTTLAYDLQCYIQNRSAQRIGFYAIIETWLFPTEIAD